MRLPDLLNIRVNCLVRPAEFESAFLPSQGSELSSCSMVTWFILFFLQYGFLVRFNKRIQSRQGRGEMGLSSKCTQKTSNSIGWSAELDSNQRSIVYETIALGH